MTGAQGAGNEMAAEWQVSMLSGAGARQVVLLFYRHVMRRTRPR